ATPSAPTVTNVGTIGSTTYDYFIVAKNANGATIPGPAGTTSTGNAILDATNYNTISWTAVANATSYDVLKGTTSTSLATSVTATTINDTGQATSAYTPNTTNTTGGDLTVNGSGLFKNTTDSTTAFRVQNAAGSNLLVVDTTNQRLAVGLAAVPAGGVLTVGTDTTTAAGGLYFGTDTNLYRSAANLLQTDDQFRVYRGNAADIAFSTYNSTNPQLSFYIQGNGNHWWGDGAGVVDTVLFRGGADMLATNDQFNISRSSATDSALSAGVSGDAFNRFVLRQDGALLFGDGTAATDTNLYRSAADTLQTDDSFVLNGTGSNLTVQGTGTSNFAGNLDVAGRAAFGPTANIFSTTTVNIEETRTDTAGGGREAIYSSITGNPAAASSSSFRGAQLLANSQSGNIQNFYVLEGANIGGTHRGTGSVDFLSGAFLTAQNVSSGTVTDAKGSNNFIYNSSSGTITSAKGVNAIVGNAGTGTITDGYGVHIQSASNSGGGTFTNNYGLYIQDQSGVGSSNSYNLFSAGATAKNLIEGKLQVGSSQTISRINIGADTDTAAAGGITFGTDTNLYRSAANVLKTDDSFSIQTATNSATAFQVQNAAGTNLLSVNTNDGKIIANADINLSADKTLTLDGSTGNATLKYLSGTSSIQLGNYNAGGDIQVQSDSFKFLNTTDYSTNFQINNNGEAIFKNRSDSSTAFHIQNAAGQNLLVADTTNQRLAVGPAAVPANGILTVGTDTTTASGGLYFGTDTNLYRSAANTLKTDDSFIAANITTAITTKTANYTATASDSVILGDAGGGSIVISLPSAVGINGRTYTIKKIDSSLNTVTMDPDGTETIDGNATTAIGTQWTTRQITSDGANWVITGSLGSL
ncbi:hypothetical protein KY385_01995, partial [Candidatus Parcubacteria bacterium]|nr:hypothetical protein [Candidatus Parcubacteria bacterium]